MLPRETVQTQTGGFFTRQYFLLSLCAVTIAHSSRHTFWRTLKELRVEALLLWGGLGTTWVDNEKNSTYQSSRLFLTWIKHIKSTIVFFSLLEGGHAVVTRLSCQHNWTVAHVTDTDKTLLRIIRLGIFISRFWDKKKHNTRETELGTIWHLDSDFGPEEKPKDDQVKMYVFRK